MPSARDSGIIAAMRTLGTCIAGACLLMFGACHDPRPDAMLPDEGADLPILRQFAGPDSGEQQRMQVVVRREDDWARIPLIDAPIDFGQEMALVITLGRTISDRQSIRIARVWRQGRQLRVAISTTPPPAGAPLSEATPYCVAIVPHCELEVAGFLPEPPGYKQRKTGALQRLPAGPRRGSDRPIPMEGKSRVPGS